MLVYGAGADVSVYGAGADVSVSGAGVSVFQLGLRTRPDLSVLANIAYFCSH